ncbi:hypothetical protein, partial [Patulibacter sp.]|uniref:hypothetical protein n=1 Tax=Patulibacter sp. TaxID=1912859 RepID=UPI002724E9E1
GAAAGVHGTPGTQTGAIPGPAAHQEPADGDTASFRSRAADRTAEGARVAADRASSAASATVQALRETDVNEIARSTTGLIENTRPFFLTLFALGFAILAAFENHAAVGVMFGIGATLCVLGAAYSREIDLLLTGRATDGRTRGGSAD